MFWFIQIKVEILKDSKLEDITFQKVLLRIIISSFDQSIDSHTILGSKITGKVADYSTGYLLWIHNNYYRLIAVDFNTQKESYFHPKKMHQIDFVGQLKNTDSENADCTPSIFVLTVLEKIKEMILNFFKGSVSV